MIAQGSIVRPRQEFSFKVNGKGRTITFKVDRYWIANSITDQEATGRIEICRMNQSMGTGYRFSQTEFEDLFLCD